ncbi:hypothetical protein K6M90_25395 [Rhizobium sp. 9T]|uniref:hypothetical protein n=1 Tax=Rhizobium croatiense TaxID=2867516 RepID=UPI001C933147|nr:hypothetical protein [Rhizobium croatiense]MBY4610984.1 hypothetical protein [Rhizobium croatiense]
MISKSVELYGFKLPPGEFTIVIGEESLDVFNKFINKGLSWAVSGVDWTKSKYIERCEVGDKLSIIELLTNIREKYKLNGRYSLWFESSYPVLISGDIKHLCDMVSFFDEHPFMSCADFWIFSENTGECIEIYHEDTITLGLSAGASS